ncbi:unnamed protein product [Tuber aestivum]|uniref:Uncharacterized protein n=1 Tax=Tuber aestivum TaxID=59557 RepID=A0A292PPQ7_9PEZI|nr:unnamed protein product [Tuber aestivum]
MAFFLRTLLPPKFPFNPITRHVRTLATSRRGRVKRALQVQGPELPSQESYQFGDDLSMLEDNLYVRYQETFGELHLKFMGVIHGARIRLEEDLQAAHDRLETDIRELHHIYLKHSDLTKFDSGKKHEQTLIVGVGSPHDVAADANHMLKLAGKCHVRGAIERIVYQGKLLGKISYASNIQDGLNSLALCDEFAIALGEEVKARGLKPRVVRRCVAGLYNLVCTRTHTNESTIIVRAGQYFPNDVAALVTFLKVQSTWPYALSWTEDKSSEDRYGGDSSGEGESGEQDESGEDESGEQDESGEED